MNAQQMVLATGTPEELAEYIIRTRTTSIMVANNMGSLFMQMSAEPKTGSVVPMVGGRAITERDRKRFAAIMSEDATQQQIDDLVRASYKASQRPANRGKLSSQRSKMECLAPGCHRSTTSYNGICQVHQRDMVQATPKVRRYRTKRAAPKVVKY